MHDKTTDGHHASVAEIEGMLRNLCAYALTDPDPLQRYADLTHQQVLFDGVVAAIRRERGKALADLMSMGVPLAKVAELAGLDAAAQARSLMTAAGVKPPTARKGASSRRRAAVPASPKALPARPAEAKSAGQAGAARSGRSGAPVLPAAVVSHGKRTLTPEERRALGLLPV